MMVYQPTDKFGNKLSIIIEDNGMNVIAKCDNKIIGTIGFDVKTYDRGAGYDGEIVFLYSMDVESEYRNLGIATEMMRIAVNNLHGKFFSRPRLETVKMERMEPHEYFTDDGKAFIEKCIKDGILDEDEENPYN